MKGEDRVMEERIQDIIDERMVTDAQVFAVFDLHYPGLEKVNQAVALGELETAKKELVSYFHERRNVSFLFDYRGTPLKKLEEDPLPYFFQASVGNTQSVKPFMLEAGRRLMENIYSMSGNKIKPVNLGKEMEFAPHFNCRTDHGKKTRTTSNMFTRGQWLEYLWVLYQETGNAEVVEKFKALLEDFWKQYPLLVENREIDANRFQYSEDRTVMSVGWLALSYMELLYTELPYKAGTEVAFGLLKRICFIGTQFARFEKDGYRPFNHHLWERGLLPFILGVVFPEIPEFRNMKSWGAETVCRHVKDDFNEQGGYNEHSLGYWAGAALGEMLFRGGYLAKVNGEVLWDQEAEERLQTTFWVLAAIAPPGLVYPSFGDGGGASVAHTLRLAEQMIQNPSCHQLLCYRSGQKADISELPLYYSSDKTGFTCARTGYGPKATYMLMSAKVNCGRSGHNHMDMLSLSLWVRGQELIGESCARKMYSYVRMGSAARGYHYNMTSHNTVLAYGQPIAPDEMYANQWGVYRPDSPVLSVFQGDGGMAVKTMHGGYSFCGHYRDVAFTAQGDLFIRDEIRPGRRSEKVSIQRWHLTPGCVVKKLAKDAILIEKEGVKLFGFWYGSSELRLWKNTELLCPEFYETEEELGWILDVTFGETYYGEAGEEQADLRCVWMDGTDRTALDTHEMISWLSEQTKGKKLELILNELNNI